MQDLFIFIDLQETFVLENFNNETNITYM